MVRRVGPYRGVAQDEHEGACPWCHRTVRYEAGADTVVCGCGARSAIALVKPQLVLMRPPRKHDVVASTDTSGAGVLAEIAMWLLGFLIDLF